MTQAKIDLKKLREQAMIHTSRFPVLQLLDALDETRAALDIVNKHGGLTHYDDCAAVDEVRCLEMS